MERGTSEAYMQRTRSSLDGDRSRSGRSDSPVAGKNFPGRPGDCKRQRSKMAVYRLFRAPQGRRQPVAVDEAWPFGGLSSFKPPVFGPSGAVPGVTAPDTEDWDMGQGDVYIHNAPVLPNNPIFKGSTKEEQRAFMVSYNQYISQTNALTANGVDHF
ncbi:hypothetical protein H257_03280 [Aphanomyces astaci]|uniref:Uncharacterized protein n=1 Tax=Aphanomyces astaci TaxID=112090 RepID=W4H117_APHAT|nr:hypothetical protein H257_03280 [Aphanomyces astaci]ETV85572.1 hypothetical protein H257_03280 [Aphanomyces astaci]|eukprot:XP_009825590.1 hypothetical protein H257_03280 [Aphanomyces astaci]